jgi:RimJ/RimL family protein N-acetyltransferase
MSYPSGIVSGMPDQFTVGVEPWAESDLDLQRRINAPEMMGHLGGPETDEQVVARNQRYAALAGTGTGRMFRIVLLPGHEPAGGVGYWEKAWHGETVFEAGWSVLPEFQGRGIASDAIAAAAVIAGADGKHRYMHAYPRIDHPASNGVCRKAGFELVGPCDFEYPVGNPIRCNDWRLDLHTIT